MRRQGTAQERRRTASLRMDCFIFVHFIAIKRDLAMLFQLAELAGETVAQE
jgi:hypothetical protein